MKYSKLGSSGLSVSRVCLGSMTWGVQNTQEDANEQIEYALSRGVNFMDTAEMYAIPPSPDTYGKTEEIIGNWLGANPERRGEIILATKIAGVGLPWVRDGGEITGAAITESIEASLKRLQTDYIDLYQMHWPNRETPHFSKHHPSMVNFTNVDTAAHSAQMLEILQALDAAVKAGKIRHFGLSDDSPWGINEYIRLSEKHDLTRVTSIQNEFSLLHTKDWPYLIENCVHADVAYLPWSALAAGALSGKYIDGSRPEGSRWTMEQRNWLFRDNDVTNEAVKEYKALAEKNGMTAAQLALAWCDQVDGVTSTIIGATTMDQLKEDIDAFEIEFSDELKADIAAIHRKYPVPF